MELLQRGVEHCSTMTIAVGTHQFCVFFRHQASHFAAGVPKGAFRMEGTPPGMELRPIDRGKCTAWTAVHGPLHTPIKLKAEFILRERPADVGY